MLTFVQNYNNALIFSTTDRLRAEWLGRLPTYQPTYLPTNLPTYLPISILKYLHTNAWHSFFPLQRAEISFVYNQRKGFFNLPKSRML